MLPIGKWTSSSTAVKKILYLYVQSGRLVYIVIAISIRRRKTEKRFLNGCNEACTVSVKSGRFPFAMSIGRRKIKKWILNGCDKACIFSVESGRPGTMIVAMSIRRRKIEKWISYGCDEACAISRCVHFIPQQRSLSSRIQLSPRCFPRQ
jgi:hypothetical protein